MSSGQFKSTYNLQNKPLIKRYSKTLSFLKKAVPAPVRVLDLGVKNLFTEIMEKEGYTVTNTPDGMDLDLDFQIVEQPDFELVTAFEIFEHMVAPYNLLRNIQAPKLVASVPLRLWFATAYWNPNDAWDRHYHEFEPRQFNMLLQKSGWKIISSEQWTSPVNKLGIRPILRRFYPRYYIVYCTR